MLGCMGLWLFVVPAPAVNVTNNTIRHSNFEALQKFSIPVSILLVCVYYIES